MDLNCDSDDKEGGALCNDSDDWPLDDLRRRRACEARGSDRAVCPAFRTAGAPSFIADDKDGAPLATTRTTDRSKPSAGGELA